MKQAKVFYTNLLAGILTETDEDYVFQYAGEYLENQEARPVSHTLPLQKEAFHSRMLFPFFDGLIPEGWLLDIAENNWKIKANDRMSLLLACCRDCIGAVSVVPLQGEELL